MTTTADIFAPEAASILGRYLQDGETQEDLIRRISWGNPDYEDMFRRLDFLANSPTMMNGGLGRGTLSACFHVVPEDSLDSIMDMAKVAAKVLQSGGGIGYALSKLRHKGAPVKGIHGTAGGPLAWMDIYHQVAMSVTQNGVRQAAQMAILRCDHPDILDFIHAKDTEQKAQSLSTFNISVAITDDFMSKAIDKTAPSYRLHDHHGDDCGFITPYYVLRDMANAAMLGDPGCYFIDRAERDNPTPWMGKLLGTNPCGEVPLMHMEPCNLGSINLAHHLHEEYGIVTIDWIKLEQTTRLAIRYLDDTLDHNIFPTPEIDAAARLTRKLGLGVMGWADMLATMHIHYDSDEAVALADEIGGRMREWADSESYNIALEKGPAPCWSWAPNYEEKLLYRRNATVLCIAPTGSIAQLAGCSYGIEPHFALEWDHKTHKEGLIHHKLDFGDFIPHTTHDIHWSWHVKHQAAWQKHVDLAVSKTINMTREATPDDIRNAYAMAWEMGCKGITVYRDGSREGQVLTTTTVDPLLTSTTSIRNTAAATIDFTALLSQPKGLKARLNRIGTIEKLAMDIIAESAGPTHPRTHSNGRRHLPDTRQSLTHKFTVGDQEGYITVGLYEDGRPGELFITASKAGSTVQGLYNTIGILTSYALQYGVPLSGLCDKLQGTHFEPSGLVLGSSIGIKHADSVVDYIYHWLLHTFEPSTLDNGHHQGTWPPIMGGSIAPASGSLCPSCGSHLLMAEGCRICPGCGWTKC